MKHKLDDLIAQKTGFSSFAHLVSDKNGSYTPTCRIDSDEAYRVIADAYDAYMIAEGISKRAYRVLPKAEQENAVMEFRYADAFDKEHYPQTDEQHASMVCIAFQMGLNTNFDGEYHATSHGAIYTFDMSAMHRHETEGKQRIDRRQMLFLLDVPGFRWIEVEGNEVRIGLEHKI